MDQTQMNIGARHIGFSYLHETRNTKWTDRLNPSPELYTKMYTLGTRFTYNKADPHKRQLFQRLYQRDIKLPYQFGLQRETVRRLVYMQRALQSYFEWTNRDHDHYHYWMCYFLRRRPKFFCNYHIMEIVAVYLTLQDLKKPLDLLSILRIFQTHFDCRLQSLLKIHHFFAQYVPKPRQVIERNPMAETIAEFIQNPIVSKRALALTKNILLFKEKLVQNVNLLLKNQTIPTLSRSIMVAAIYGAILLMCVRVPRGLRFQQQEIALLFNLSMVGLRIPYNKYFRNLVSKKLNFWRQHHQ